MRSGSAASATPRLRSRVLELDVISRQFGPVLPTDVLEKLRLDLVDLEKATESKRYVDDSVSYLGGHPKHDERGSGTLTLDDELIRFVSIDGTTRLGIPKASVENVYFENQGLGMEQAEAEEEAPIGLNEILLRPTTVVVVKDPEGVLPEGFNVRFGFRNEYYGRLFSRKCSDKFGLFPF
jgi:hypothetical protein